MIKREEGGTLRRMRGKEPICRLCCNRSFAVTRSSSCNCNYKHNVLHGELVIFASVQDMEKRDIFTNSTIRLLRLGSFQQLAPTVLYSCYKLHSKTSREY